MPSIIKVDQIQSDQGFVNVSSNLQFSSGFTMLSPTTSGVLTLGAGIKFPATQVPSADANTLDDYEEGTWTPTIGGSSTNPTVAYSNQYGRYTKIGNVVYVTFRLTFTFSGGSGTVELGGLPFTVAGSTHPRAPIQQDNITYTGFTYLEVGANQNSTTAGLGKNRSGASAAGVAISDLNTGGTDMNTGFYYFV